MTNKVNMGLCLAVVLLSTVTSFHGAEPAKSAAKAKAKRDAGLLAIPQVSKDDVICFALYTVQRGILKLTAQLYPLEDSAPREVRLEVQRDGSWHEVARTQIINPGWTAPFRVENWDAARDVPYRVRHGESAVYKGVIKRDPLDKK